jgi:hypothetical protein
MRVFVGFCPPDVTNTEPSATNTLSSPCTCPYGSVTLDRGSAPIIMPPMMWKPVGSPPLSVVAGTASVTAAPAAASIFFSTGT